MTGQFFWPEVLLINKKRLEGLKPEYQAAIKQAAKEAIEPQITAAEASEVKDRAGTVVKLGVTFDEVFAGDESGDAQGGAADLPDLHGKGPFDSSICCSGRTPAVDIESWPIMAGGGAGQQARLVPPGKLTAP